MTLTGHVKNGHIVFDDESPSLPEGAEVRVEIVAVPPRRTLAERLKGAIGKAEGLPPDAASRVDDYLYGDDAT